jgi:hypothetical protein
MVIDMNVRRRMRQAKMFIAFMLGTTLAGIIWDDLAFYALFVNGFVWTAWYANKFEQSRRLELVDDKRLHDRNSAK